MAQRRWAKTRVAHGMRAKYQHEISAWQQQRIMASQ